MTKQLVEDLGRVTWTWPRSKVKAKQGGPENPKAKTDVCFWPVAARTKGCRNHIYFESVVNHTAAAARRLVPGTVPGMPVRTLRLQTRPRRPSRMTWRSAGATRRPVPALFPQSMTVGTQLSRPHPPLADPPSTLSTRHDLRGCAYEPMSAWRL